MKIKPRIDAMSVAGAAILMAVGSVNGALIGHYQLDSISGGTTPDAAIVNGDGVINGTVTLSGAGKIGSAVNFTAANANFIGIPDAGFGQTAFTASVWFKPTSIANGDPLSNWTNAGSSPRTFIIRSGTGLETFVRENGTAQIGGAVAFPTQTLSTTDFNHAVITYDGQNLRTYLNGELSTTVNSFASPRAIGEGVKGTAAIGGRGSSEGNMDGLVDDVSFWNETLSSGKVGAIFSVADTAALNYDASQANQLFRVFDGSVKAVAIGDKVWALDSNKGGSAGSTVDLGSGDFFVNLDGTAGVSTLRGGSFVTVAQFDVNNGASPTQSGFLGLSSTGNGTQNGITLTSTVLDEFRDRGEQLSLLGHPLASVLRDFGFENDNSSVDFLLSGLTPNTQHELTIYQFDLSGNAGSTVDWYQDAIAGIPLATHVLVGGQPDLADFTFRAFSDAQGEIRLIADIQSGILVFNGLSIAELRQTIPEPATATLAVLGLGGIMMRRRRMA